MRLQYGPLLYCTCRKEVRRVGLNYHIDQNWEKIVGSGHGLLDGEGEQVHDGDGHAEDAAHLVLRQLVRRQPLQLGLTREKYKMTERDR